MFGLCLGLWIHEWIFLHIFINKCNHGTGFFFTQTLGIPLNSCIMEDHWSRHTWFWVSQFSACVYNNNTENQCDENQIQFESTPYSLQEYMDQLCKMGFIGKNESDIYMKQYELVLYTDYLLTEVEYLELMRIFSSLLSRFHLLIRLLSKHIYFHIKQMNICYQRLKNNDLASSIIVHD